MVKRKRHEPKLDAQLQDLEVKLFRALKTSKGFERQRLAKRVREANPDKVERLEREVAVLKSLDLHQAAHAILCSQLLKIKGVAESPHLPETIKPVPKPNITEDERSALHNVTSGLCNRKQVKDVLDEAVKATCLSLRVDLPGKAGKGAKGKATKREEQEEQADDREEKPARKAKTAVESTKSKTQKKPAESDEESEDEWGGVSGDEGHASDDEDEEEKALSRYEALLGGSSDSEGDYLESDENDLQNSRSAAIKKGSQTEVRGPSDYFSGGESEADDDDNAMDLDDEEEDEEEEAEEEDEEEESDGSDSEAVTPPPKKKRVAKPVATRDGDSTFLPSLMGGYISGSESDASDVDVAPARNNRRGQRARQAIWEKKFKQEAKHLNKPKDSRDAGWDPKRGAVGNEHGAPWKQGIKSAFDKRDKAAEPAPEGVHPDRQRNFDESAPANPSHRNSRDSRPPHRNNFGGGSAPSRSFEPAVEAAPKPPPKPAKPKRDDTGALHASWEMAKAAKEKTQNAKFEGKKITFD
ncbi:uncharacterized protein PG998_013367 [Apiospora kogelbergensis]|uniref:uncharacterized protein n=1 Tax=Apiospora kogelbergensis TaxID=1337665 RepID=UPI0031310551